ncbi:MAG: hypothetical protein MUF81_11210 [Verrucomicrobia bacterium]|nr:hypothetical protein [Verrucomicrobiota bacterium]
MKAETPGQTQLNKPQNAPEMGRDISPRCPRLRQQAERMSRKHDFCHAFSVGTARRAVPTSNLDASALDETLKVTPFVSLTSSFILHPSSF